MNSILPLTDATSYNLDSAILSCIAQLSASVSRFDAATEKVMHTYAGNELAENVQKFLDGSRYLCTGNLSCR